MKISWTKAKNNLASIWFIGAGVAFAIMFFQTVLGSYQGIADKAWSWFLPTVVPTLTLMIGVFVSEAFTSEESRKMMVNRFFYKLSFTLSIAYLLVVILSLLLQPFSPLSVEDQMTQSNLWLTPLQALVSAALGAFFVKKGME